MLFVFLEYVSLTAIWLGMGVLLCMYVFFFVSSFITFKVPWHQCLVVVAVAVYVSDIAVSIAVMLFMYLFMYKVHVVHVRSEIWLLYCYM